MKFKVERYGIEVIPENREDEAYIEDTMGLKEGGDAILLVREDAVGMHCLTHLTTHFYRKKDVRLIGDSLELLGVVKRSLEKHMSDKTTAPDLGEITYGHQDINDIIDWFAYSHLPVELQAVSKPVGELAHEMALVGSGQELLAGLRHLLEAKDCFVRAAKYKIAAEVDAEKEDDSD